MEQKLICINCMQALAPDTDICPHCGCDQNTLCPQQNLTPGTILQERYFVGKAQHSNGEGITYSAYDMVTENRVELREFFPESLCKRDRDSDRVVPNPGDESRLKALMLDFVDLAKTMTRSRSLTAIIPVLDVFEDNNTVYMVSQYVEAITLKDYLLRKGGEMTWDECKAKFAPVISALNTIHSTVSQYHLGISPETILVDKFEQFKITGFSIEALRVAKSDIIPELAPGYAAPEQYNSANWIGPWTDVYALAAVIYKCLTGTMPPESSGRIVGETLVPANKLVKSVPINISNVLFKAMSISPEKRTQSIEDLILAFTEEANFESEVPADQKSGRSKMVYIWSAVIAVCLIVIAVLAWILIPMIMGNDEPKEPISTSEVSSEASSDPEESESASAEANVLENYVGMKYDDIKSELSKIVKVKIKTVFSTKKNEQKGVILKQSLPEGTEVTPDSTLTLTVSKGPEFIYYTDLIGNTRTAVYVKSYLTRNGIDPKRISVVEVHTDYFDEDGMVLEIESKEKGRIEVYGKDPVVIHVSKYSTEQPEISSAPENSESGSLS